MRLAHFPAPLWMAALAAASPVAWAQSPASPPSTASSSLAQALDPAAARLPLTHAALPASPGVQTELADWVQANAAVAQFPRGHMDLLQWEAAQTAAPAASAAPATPPMPVHGTHGPLHNTMHGGSQ